MELLLLVLFFIGLPVAVGVSIIVFGRKGFVEIHDTKRLPGKCDLKVVPDSARACESHEHVDDGLASVCVEEQASGHKSLSSDGDKESRGVVSKTNGEAGLNNSTIANEIGSTLESKCVVCVVDSESESSEHLGDDHNKRCADVQSHDPDPLTCEACDGCNGFDGAGHSLQFQHAQVLGACSRRGFCDDWLRAGTILSLRTDGKFVFAVCRNGRKIGVLPPRLSEQYIACPPCNRCQKVIVERDVNLNDKYGRCFVHSARCICSTISG